VGRKRGPRYAWGLNLSFWLAVLLSGWLLGFWPTELRASHGREEINYLGPDRIKGLLDGGEKILFIDIRPTKEYQEKRVPGARSIPVKELEKRLGEIPKSGRVVLYCACQPGTEDGDAFFVLKDNGYRNVAVMEEGFPGWLKRKFPVESGHR